MAKSHLGSITAEQMPCLPYLLSLLNVPGEKDQDQSTFEDPTAGITRRLFIPFLSTIPWQESPTITDLASLSTYSSLPPPACRNGAF